VAPKQFKTIKRQRLLAVQDMVVESAYPVTMLDLPAFRPMITTRDPTFKIPCKYYDTTGTGLQAQCCSKFSRPL